MSTTKNTDSSSVYGASAGTSEPMAAEPAATDTATVRM